MKKLLILCFCFSLAGCGPTKIRFHPAMTEEEHKRGYGALEEIDYGSRIIILPK